ncbi:hypothetical protein FO519_009018 [Halicephalobus sp. NKZ332]|nr:hypothetical protein FO519_009018 [Halicephalobus sp. NKZ332]
MKSEVSTQNPSTSQNPTMVYKYYVISNAQPTTVIYNNAFAKVFTSVKRPVQQVISQPFEIPGIRTFLIPGMKQLPELHPEDIDDFFSRNTGSAPKAESSAKLEYSETSNARRIPSYYVHHPNENRSIFKINSRTIQKPTVVIRPVARNPVRRLILQQLPQVRRETKEDLSDSPPILSVQPTNF